MGCILTPGLGFSLVGNKCLGGGFIGGTKPTPGGEWLPMLDPPDTCPESVVLIVVSKSLKSVISETSTVDLDFFYKVEGWILVRYEWNVAS